MLFYKNVLKPALRAVGPPASEPAQDGRPADTRENNMSAPRSPGTGRERRAAAAPRDRLELPYRPREPGPATER